MAEEGSVYELEGLEAQLQSLSSRYSSEELRADSKPFCSEFCKLVEEYASRWQVPLPQLRILEISLCYFARASTSFTSNCDHVLHTLSSLALSVFELLLFFDQDDFHQEPLTNFTDTFQECHLALASYQNVHLLQVDHLVQGGGPWASSVLQAILSESSLPQNEVDGCISSELPVFFELRVRYLLSCERVSEAMALAKCCARHPTAGQHLFFLQVYLTWLYKTSQHDCLNKEVDDLNGKDAVHIICSLECEEKDDVLLALSRAFLFQQLRRGDMYYLCDLVFIWSKLHSRLNTSKDALLEESHQLMLSAINVNSIFPFVRAILQELGEDGIQFCVELCANALESCLPCDVVTKSLIYKTIAGLLPNDLEVCRACALLVFFLERTVEAYKMVYLLYMHPDQEYHVEYSPIGNHVRFETLQILKKDLYFDPEFWNLIALRTSCLKLMSEKVVSAALEEIMEDKWIHNYCTKELGLRSSTSLCQKGSKEALQAAAKKRHHKVDRYHKEYTDTASKRLKVGPGKTRLNVDVKKKGTQGSRPLKEASSEPLRRSFWQPDRIQDNVAVGQHRRTTRLSEKNPPKRRIRKPKWLLEDSGTLEENNAPLKIKKHGLKHQKHEHQSAVVKRSETGQIKNNAKHKPSIDSHLKSRENNKHQREFSLDCLKQTPPPQVILELSLPDNELMGTFTEDTCNRQRGFPQVLFYKPTVKLPVTSQPVKTVHRKEVVLRARDATMFVQQLHCYARRQKGKGNASNVHSSVSTITRSSVQGSPPKDPPGELCEKPEMKGRIASQTATAAEVAASPAFEKVLQAQTTKAVSRKTAAARELSAKSSAEVKVTVAPETPAAAKVTKPPVLEKVPQPPSKGKVTSARELHEKSAAEMKTTVASQTSAAAEVTEASKLDKVLQAQTVASPRELCEEPAVEMKVTIASQSPAAAKMPQGDTRLDKASKAVTVEDLSKTTASAEVLQTSTAGNNHKIVTDEILPVSNTANSLNIGTTDPTPSQSHNVVLIYGERELKSLSSQAETGKIPVAQEKADTPQVLTTASNSIAEADVKEDLPTNSKGCGPCEKDTSPGGNIVTLNKVSETQATYSAIDQDSINDLSALTLVTEVVTELAPEALARDCENDKRRAPENNASKESTAGSKPKVPHKIRTASSCSVPEWEASGVADVQLKKGKGGTQGIALETPENSEAMETAPESEESKLEYCCTFCNKVFKGSRVVAHAMFHYRKDECMFCGTMFKDDLLAMMHLSDHIEKLKKSKESETKDISTPKTSAKGKTTNMSSGRRSGRSKKSAVCSKSESLQDSSPAESRKLRSNDKPVDGQFLQEKKQNTSKYLNRGTPVHKVNGHMGKKKERDTVKRDSQQEMSHARRSNESENPDLPENQDIGMSSSASSVQVEKEFGCSTEDKMKETESLQVLKAATKQNGKGVDEKNVEPQEKVCCPVDGCAWFTDLSKNRVAILYHALEEHNGELKPLELAFRVGNSRCAICMRVLWSFEHFQHHVERHRVTPRHPCLHQGCTARFKTGMEMRRHARRHSPLQAVCCLPGCSQLFICLWALNLHEREHYTSKSTKPDKIANEQTGDKHNTATGKKQLDHKPKDATAVNKTVSVKAARKLRGKATHSLSSRKLGKAPSLSNVRTSVLKQELKERNETKDSNVLKNLSNKDTSAQPTVPNLRVRQSLRKGQVTNTTLAAPKTHRVISSSLLKHSRKVRQKLKKKQVKLNEKGPKRRGRPPKSKKTVHDENTSTGQNNETGKEKTALQKDPKRPAQLSSPPKAAEPSTVSNKLTEEEEKSKQDQDVVKTTDTSVDESKSKKSLNKKNHVQQKGVSHNTSKAVTDNSLNQSITTTAADKIQKLSIDKMNKMHKAKKRSSPKEHGSQSDCSKSKKHKVTNSKVNIKTVKKKCPLKKPESSSVEAKAAAAVVVVESSADGDGKAKAESVDSTQISTCNTVPAVPANSLNEAAAPPTTSGQKTQKVTTQEKKSKVTKKERHKEKNTKSASSNSGKASKKKHKDIDKKGDKKTVKGKQPCTVPGKTSALKKTAKSKSIVQQPDETKTAAALVKSNLDEVGKAKEEASDAAHDSSGSSAPALTSSSNAQTSPPAATEEKSQKVTKKLKKPNDIKKPDPNKANKKRKNIHKEGGKKIVKKKCKDQGVSSALKEAEKSKAEVQPPTEAVAVVEEGKTSAETPQSTVSSSANSVIMNGEAASVDVKSAVCKDSLASYNKRPYMRPPPTAYLDEKYITMPKRRKEMSFFQPYPRSPPAGQAPVTATLQRQRCANCFATFNSAEDLQSHLQLQKCSNLFGFDSDDEGNS
ncbi:microtubule-associated protein futsch-like [Trachinotus anak]|uniref:microtubule-associated protein futsch-like n=1 Tax=Trachinotus anak TaxID=443729 RepID=UPI0039F18CE4